MSKIFIILIVSIGFLVYLLLSKPQNLRVTEIAIPNSQNTNNIDKSNEKYAIAWYRLEPDDEVFLGSNLEDKKQSTDIHKDNSCTTLVNAGFYSEENEHIGLFSVDNEKLGSYTGNRLFNTVLYTEENILKINDTEPENYSSAVQTGPKLITKGVLNTLNLTSDKPARRMVYLSNEDTYFLSVYTKNNAYSGPLLSELGKIVLDFAESRNMQDVDAVNLDGGSASAFITDEFALTEISPIGSYFCVVN